MNFSRANYAKLDKVEKIIEFFNFLIKMESRAKVYYLFKLGIHINVWIYCKFRDATIFPITKKNYIICKNTTWLFKFTN